MVTPLWFVVLGAFWLLVGKKRVESFRK